MEIQVGTLVDRPVSEIRFGWSRIYKHLQVDPPGASIEELEESEAYSLSDSYALGNNLTFESDNQYSVWYCFALGRENARQIRHCVSSEMWLCLNLAYLRLQQSRMQDIWLMQPDQFFAEIARDVNTFMGVADATMYRDAGWEFLNLGRGVEHIQLMSSLLAIQTGAATKQNGDAANEFAWTSLLHSYQADEAYHHDYGLEIVADQVLDMLVTDDRLPVSLIYAIEAVYERIDNLGEAPGAKAGALAGRFAGRLLSLIKYEWPDAEEKNRMFVLVQNLANRLHEQISAGWFDYKLDSSSPSRTPLLR